MLVRRLIDHWRRYDWFAVAVEMLVVVVGILLAFQVDRWWEERGERMQEVEYVERLINDIESDIPIIQRAIELAVLRKEMADLLMRVAEAPTAAYEEPIQFVVAVHQAAFTYSPNLTNHTFDELRATGNLRLLRDTEIKRALFGYYDFDQDQNQYRPLQFMGEDRHFELAAGVLSFDQARLVQDSWYVVVPGELDNFDDSLLNPEEIRATVQRFLARAALIDWLPEMRHLQNEQLLVNEDRLARARSVLELLRDYSGNLN